MNKEHCRAMFNRLGIDATKLDKYSDDAEIMQEDLDELTGWQQNYKEICAMHRVLKRAGIAAGAVALAVVSSILIKRKTA